MKFIMLMIVLSLPALAKDGDKGNGGDFIRYHFVNIVQEVIGELRKDKYKDAIKEVNINLDKIEAETQVNKIKVHTEQFKDNLGSIVDAKFEDGKIHLYYEAWWKTIVAPLYLSFAAKMVPFHEALRLSGYDDDQYRIINKLIDLKSTLSYRNDFVSGKTFTCYVKLFKKNIDSPSFPVGRKGELLATAVHQASGLNTGSSLEFLYSGGSLAKRKRVLASTSVIGGNGYFRWALSEVDENETGFYVYNPVYPISSKVLYSPYPKDKAPNKPTSFEIDDFIVEVSCSADLIRA